MINSSLLHEDIEKYYLENKAYPHCLVQLSKKEHDDLRNNSIHVEGIFMENGQVQYSEVTYIGSNIKLKKRTLNIDDKDINCHIINVTRLKKRVFCITTNVSNILKLQKDTIIIPSTSRYDNDMHEVSTAKEDGIVLLFYAMVPDTYMKYSMDMDYNFAENIKKVKDNIIKSANNHYQSQGLYYSFGNKGAFKIVNNSSVDQYAIKARAKKTHSNELNEWCSNAESVIALHLNESVNSMKRYIRNIPHLICPLLNVAYEMQKDHGCVNLKSVKTTESGMWMSSVCINARTSLFHSEEDCTYTLIKIPYQDKDMNKGNAHERMFLVRINNETMLSIPLSYNLSFLFSGNFITHRQHQSMKCYEDRSLFYNISSYGNKRLYSHLKKSFQRNQEF